jgi:peptidoglycan L-alanyl-D-glutamate endopeptidase CwlK
MTDPHRLERLTGVHPQLITIVTRICAALEALGVTMIVTDGVRTVKQQKALYEQGRSTPGEIVTQLDGVKKKSNHQLKPDGFGHAVDLCFWVDGKPSWAESNPWHLYGEIAKFEGCAWGGDWASIVDRPHIEWPKG